MKVNEQTEGDVMENEISQMVADGLTLTEALQSHSRNYCGRVDSQGVIDMVTQQEKEMLWEYFGKGSGVEIREVSQTRQFCRTEKGLSQPMQKAAATVSGSKKETTALAGLASGLPLPK